MDYAYKYLLGPLLIGFFFYKLVMYFFALNKWVKAKGVVVDYNYRNRSNYLVIKFKSANGKNFEFEGKVYPFLFVKSAYPLHSEIDILYSPSSPDVAMIHTIWSPIVYISRIIFL